MEAVVVGWVVDEGFEGLHGCFEGFCEGFCFCLGYVLEVWGVFFGEYPECHGVYACVGCEYSEVLVVGYGSWGL